MTQTAFGHFILTDSFSQLNIQTLLPIKLNTSSKEQGKPLTRNKNPSQARWHLVESLFILTVTKWLLTKEWTFLLIDITWNNLVCVSTIFKFSYLSFFSPRNTWVHRGNFFYRKSTIGTTIAAIEANKWDVLCPKTNRKIPAAWANQEELNRKLQIRTFNSPKVHRKDMRSISSDEIFRLTEPGKLYHAH